jgi:hypothetical protein
LVSSAETEVFFKRNSEVECAVPEVMDNEQIRDLYRPPVIKLLFVGESAPVGGNFFYKGDNLTSHVQYGFERTFEVKFDGYEPFLQCFKALGCYLDDLSHIPVNGLPDPEREDVLKECVPAFSHRLKLFNPQAIIVTPMKIERYVEEAKRVISFNTVDTWYLPYPSYSKRNRSGFVEGLSKALIHLRQNGAL